MILLKLNLNATNNDSEKNWIDEQTEKTILNPIKLLYRLLSNFFVAVDAVSYLITGTVYARTIWLKPIKWNEIGIFPLPKCIFLQIYFDYFLLLPQRFVFRYSGVLTTWNKVQFYKKSNLERAESKLIYLSLSIVNKKRTHQQFFRQIYSSSGAKIEKKVCCKHIRTHRDSMREQFYECKLQDNYRKNPKFFIWYFPSHFYVNWITDGLQACWMLDKLQLIN